MATMTKEPKLSGGPLDLDPQIAVAFLAHIEALATARDDPEPSRRRSGGARKP